MVSVLISGLRIRSMNFDKYIFEPLEMVDTFYEFPSEKMDRASAIWIRSDAPLPSFFQRLLLRVTAFFSGSDLIHVEELQPKSAEQVPSSSTLEEVVCIQPLLITAKFCGCY